MTDRSLVALTGGSGFIGDYILRALTGAGWRVRVLARRPFVLPDGVSPESVETITGDLSDTAALDRLVSGADVLVHAAGVIKAANRAGFFAVNDQGCRAVAAAWARHNPAGRVIYLSSLAARHPHLSAYAASKRAGEKAFSGLASVVILRPAAVYGPGDVETARFFRAARGGIFPVPLSAGKVTMIHAADVASAVAAFCNGGVAARYALTDARVTGYSWQELAAAFAWANGRATVPFLVAVPQGALTLASVLIVLWARLCGQPAMVTPGKVRELYHDWACALRHLPPAGVWQPHIASADGFADTVRWLAQQEG